MPKNNYRNTIQDERLSKTEEHLGVINEELSSINVDIAKIKTDLSWLKKNYWLVASASVGALIGALINLWIK